LNERKRVVLGSGDSCPRRASRRRGLGKPDNDFFFSALHFLGLSLIPVTVPLIFVAETTFPEK